MISKRCVAFLCQFSLFFANGLTLRQIVSTDDYMPMPIQTLEEYDKVLNVSWYAPEASGEEQVYVLILHESQSREKADKFYSFPCILPFSRMYPLCCIDIRNFLNQFYFFANDDFSHPGVIDDTLKDVRSCACVSRQFLMLHIGPRRSPFTKSM